jgi:hypothetical protein
MLRLCFRRALHQSSDGGHAYRLAQRFLCNSHKPLVTSVDERFAQIDSLTCLFDFYPDGLAKHLAAAKDIPHASRVILQHLRDEYKNELPRKNCQNRVLPPQSAPSMSAPEQSIALTNAFILRLNTTARSFMAGKDPNTVIIDAQKSLREQTGDEKLQLFGIGFNCDAKDCQDKRTFSPEDLEEFRCATCSIDLDICHSCLQRQNTLCQWCSTHATPIPK